MQRILDGKGARVEAMYTPVTSANEFFPRPAMLAPSVARAASILGGGAHGTPGIETATRKHQGAAASAPDSLQEGATACRPAGLATSAAAAASDAIYAASASVVTAPLLREYSRSAYAALPEVAAASLLPRTHAAFASVLSSAIDTPEWCRSTPPSSAIDTTTATATKTGVEPEHLWHPFAPLSKPLVRGTDGLVITGTECAAWGGSTTHEPIRNYIVLAMLFPPHSDASSLSEGVAGPRLPHRVWTVPVPTRAQVMRQAARSSSSSNDAGSPDFVRDLAWLPMTRQPGTDGTHGESADHSVAVIALGPYLALLDVRCRDLRDIGGSRCCEYCSDAKSLFSLTPLLLLTGRAIAATGDDADEDLEDGEMIVDAAAHYRRSPSPFPHSDDIRCLAVPPSPSFPTTGSGIVVATAGFDGRVVVHAIDLVPAAADPSRAPAGSTEHLPWCSCVCAEAAGAPPGYRVTPRTPASPGYRVTHSWSIPGVAALAYQPQRPQQLCVTTDGGRVSVLDTLSGTCLATVSTSLPALFTVAAMRASSTGSTPMLAGSGAGYLVSLDLQPQPQRGAAAAAESAAAAAAAAAGRSPQAEEALASVRLVKDPVVAEVGHIEHAQVRGPSSLAPLRDAVLVSGAGGWSLWQTARSAAVAAQAAAPTQGLALVACGSIHMPVGAQRFPPAGLAGSVLSAVQTPRPMAGGANLNDSGVWARSAGDDDRISAYDYFLRAKAAAVWMHTPTRSFVVVTDSYGAIAAYDVATLTGVTAALSRAAFRAWSPLRAELEIMRDPSWSGAVMTPASLSRWPAAAGNSLSSGSRLLESASSRTIGHDGADCVPGTDSSATSRVAGVGAAFHMHSGLHGRTQAAAEAHYRDLQLALGMSDSLLPLCINSPSAASVAASISSLSKSFGGLSLPPLDNDNVHATGNLYGGAAAIVDQYSYLMEEDAPLSPAKA